MTRTNRQGPYSAITALSRGLAVLSEISHQEGDVSDLSRRTGLNRTTVYRILSTLEADGYLVRSPSSHRYRLAAKVRRLSDGFTDALWVVHLAAPALKNVLRDTSWPGNIATFDGRRMLMRESSHRLSSFLVGSSMVGKTVPLSTSLGQAFLAFSGDALRNRMLPAFIEDWSESGYGKLSTDEGMAVLDRVRKSGAAVTVAAYEAGVAAIGMPILRDGKALAAMNVSMTPEALRSVDGMKLVRKQLTAEIESIEERISLEAL